VQLGSQAPHDLADAFNANPKLQFVQLAAFPGLEQLEQPAAQGSQFREVVLKLCPSGQLIQLVPLR
jgi:hypothetical protein